MNSDGSIRMDRVPAGLRRLVESRAELVDEIHMWNVENPGTAMPCIEIKVHRTRHPGVAAPNVDSLQVIVDASRISFSGIVESTTPGFRYGRPVTMLEVAVGEVFRWTPGDAVPSRLHVPVPVGRVQIGPVAICGESGHGWPAAPVVGDEVFVFSKQGRVDPDSYLYSVAADGTEFVMVRDGEIVAPRALQATVGIGDAPSVAAFRANLLRARR